MKPRHKLFADEWLRNGNNSTQAYLYISPNVTQRTARVEGTRYLAKPNIKQYIAEKQANTAKKLQIDFEWILEQQQFILNLAYIRQKINESTGEVYDAPDLTNANKALDQLSKLIGAYAPVKQENKNLNQDVTIQVQVNKYNDADSTSNQSTT